MEPMIATRTWMDERKVDWCTFATAEGREITVGLSSEEFVGLRNRFGCDLQLVCRLAIEQLGVRSAEDRPIVIDGAVFRGMRKALDEWEFRHERIGESTGITTVEDAIQAIAGRLNKGSSEGWEYFYTEQYPPRAHVGDLAGARFMFRRKRASR